VKGVSSGVGQPVQLRQPAQVDRRICHTKWKKAQTQDTNAHGYARRRTGRQSRRLSLLPSPAAAAPAALPPAPAASHREYRVVINEFSARGLPFFNNRHVAGGGAGVRVVPKGRGRTGRVPPQHAHVLLDAEHGLHASPLAVLHRRGHRGGAGRVECATAWAPSHNSFLKAHWCA
jgi:hypothetical protein